MTQSIEQLDQSDLKERISSLYSYLFTYQNEHLSKKLEQLAEKMMEKEYSVAFCGHFSAGKSTMINRLIGENLLPSSPIPTSANLVKVKTGEEYAKVYFKDEKPRMYLPPYNYEHVKNYCKDGDQIEWVEISHADSNLPKGMVILDTPGIDSTDDAHRIATESALHLADMIFYVMDYNHVQSEVNFLFTKDLSIAGKEIYLVINQIDKHRDAELSFTAFKQSVEDSFASWGVKPKGIYYTSLREMGHPQNQFEELQGFIHERINHIDKYLKESLFTSLKQLGNEQILWLEEQKSEQESQTLELLEELPEDKREHLEKIGIELNNQLIGFETALENFQKNYKEETDKIIKNAYLMPFQTRELAESFLQANQEGFKVGFLFSKQKTETERLNRLNHFYNDLHEKISAQLDWHLRSFFQQIVKEQQIQNIDILNDCQDYQTPFSKEVLVSNVKPGAVLSGEYLLNYTNDVVSEIMREAKKIVRDIGERLYNAVELKQIERKKRVKLEWDNIKPFLDAKSKLLEWQSKYAAEKLTIELILEGKKSLPYQEALFQYKEEQVEIVKDFDHSFVNEEIEYEDIMNEPINKTSQTSFNNSKDELVYKLKRTSKEISIINGFEQTALELLDKASRIENQGFTVALFGAFSAGKSSFANALMGAEVLPVSPNPTTAAINKILPITAQYPHGTVRVKLKDSEQLLNEVGRSLRVFDLQANDFQEALSHIEKIISQSTDFIGNEKIHFSFLNAFNQGFSFLSSSLGDILQTDLGEFRDFVANEAKSCFVEWIELYYDCEFTRKGITLVDTPGADSINARHTGVAFDYIKNSDAILFVTYYNHAFSKADREFLIQLGRVKDTFELDKMFFIINAVDLASNEEEVDSVIKYVKSQLAFFGIRKPNMFALSSLLALKEKLQVEKSSSSNMNDFENSFYQFISEDLLKTSLASAESELQRIIHEIKILIQASNEDENLKVVKRKQLLLQKETANSTLNKQSIDYLEARVSQELDELLFYIKQRVFLRFNDFFRESFNPAILKDDGRNMKKALNGALEELLLSVGYDFAQELRATSLRMDAYLRKSLGEFHHSVSHSLWDINKDLNVSIREYQQNHQLEFTNAFDHLNRDMFAKAMSLFKNPKVFFEKNEKKQMSDELYELLQNPAEVYIKIEGEKLKNLYKQLLKELFTVQVTHFKAEIDAFYGRFISSLDNKGQVEQLSKVLKSIDNE